MKKLIVLLAAGAATLALAGAAAAGITFNPLFGTGFVGKGDVQTALGWNNPTLRSEVAEGNVEFEFGQYQNYQWACKTNTDLTLTVTGEAHGVVGAIPAYDSRKNSQDFITGFNLTGYEDVSGLTFDYTPGYALCVAFHGYTTIYDDSGPVTLYVNGIPLTVH